MNKIFGEKRTLRENELGNRPKTEDKIDLVTVLLMIALTGLFMLGLHLAGVWGLNIK